MKIYQNLILAFTIFSCSFAQEIPNFAQKLINVYPNYIVGFKDNNLLFWDNTKLIFDDKILKKNQQLLDIPDIEDQFYNGFSDFNNDSGRIRNEALFKKMYGKNATEVQKNLVTINWCPKLVNQKIKVTKINNVHLKLQKVSAALDQHPEWKMYISNIGGTYLWRKIAGTYRQSAHSFGMTIDLNVRFSNYWQWDCKCSNENVKLSYKNKIPLQIVAIFRENGFIWGGNWQHYDTMHFEYRPELIL